MSKRALSIGAPIFLALTFATIAHSPPAPAQPILNAFTGLPGNAGDCKWFDDNLNAGRDVGTLSRQTDMLYNRLALPVDTNVSVTSTATTDEGDQVAGYHVGSRAICSTAEAIYGAPPGPSATPPPSPM